MARFEYKTQGGFHDPETIEAYDYTLDMAGRILTFTDEDGDKLASFAVSEGAFVKRLK
jgi:hypothetical protein